MRAIPISAAERIAKTYGYDQIIVIGRKVGGGAFRDPGGEHITTYGVNRENCSAAAKIGRKLQEIFGWKSLPERQHVKQLDDAQQENRDPDRAFAEGCDDGAKESGQHENKGNGEHL